MPAEGPATDQSGLRFLLDEHYPGWLAEGLTEAGVDTVALNFHRPELRAQKDQVVLEAAVAEGRVVVTEDVNTFAAAIRAVPDHVGVVYCHHARFPRTPSGLKKLHRALVDLTLDPPPGLGARPIEWWLADLR